MPDSSPFEPHVGARPGDTLTKLRFTAQSGGLKPPARTGREEQAAYASALTPLLAEAVRAYPARKGAIQVIVARPSHLSFDILARSLSQAVEDLATLRELLRNLFADPERSTAEHWFGSGFGLQVTITPLANDSKKGQNKKQQGKQQRRKPVPEVQSVHSPLITQVVSHEAKAIKDAQEAIDQNRAAAAVKLQPAIASLLAAELAAEFATKSRVAAEVNTALESVGCTLVGADKTPCRLKAERSGKGDHTAHWVLDPLDGRSKPSTVPLTEAVLPALTIMPVSELPPDAAHQAVRELVAPVMHKLNEQLEDAAGFVAAELARRQVSKSHADPVAAGEGAVALLAALNGGLDSSPAAVRAAVRAAIHIPVEQFAPAFNSWLQSQTAATHAEKLELVDTIRLLVSGMGLRLTYGGQPCSLTTSKDESQPNGRISIQDYETKDRLTTKSKPGDFEDFSFLDIGGTDLETREWMEQSEKKRRKSNKGKV